MNLSCITGHQWKDGACARCGILDGQQFFWRESDRLPYVQKRVAELFTEGMAYKGKDEQAQARSCFQHVVRLQPDHADAWCELAMLSETYFTRLGNIQRALQANPESDTAWRIRGDIYRLYKLHRNAAICFAKALALNPDFLPVWKRLALVLFLDDLLETSTLCFLHVVAIDLNHIDAWFVLGHAFTKRQYEALGIECWQISATLGEQKSQEQLTKRGQTWPASLPNDVPALVERCQQALHAMSGLSGAAAIALMRDLASQAPADPSREEIIADLERRGASGYIISDSRAQHFNTIVQLMDMVEATRHGSVREQYQYRYYIFDRYTLPGGRSLKAGYPD